MAQIDQMQDAMRELQSQNNRKDEEMGVFMNMFKAGQLASDENGTISIVADPNEQQRIANGFYQSSMGNIDSKTKEQLNFESAHKGSSLADQQDEDF